MVGTENLEYPPVRSYAIDAEASRLKGTLRVFLVEPKADLPHANREGKDNPLCGKHNIPEIGWSGTKFLHVAQRRSCMDQGFGNIAMRALVVEKCQDPAVLRPLQIFWNLLQAQNHCLFKADERRSSTDSSALS